MPPQQRTDSLDSFTHSYLRSMLIPSHSSQSTFSIHKRDQDLVSATLRSSWTHKPACTLESFIQQEQQQQQQQTPLRRNEGLGSINNTTSYYSNYYYNVYPHYYNSYSYNDYPRYYFCPTVSTQTTPPASTTRQTTTPDTTTTATTEPTTPRSFAASLKSSPSHYRLFPEEQQQVWGQACEYQTAFSYNHPHSYHATKDFPKYYSFPSSNASSVVNQAPFTQEQQQPRVYGFQSNSNHWCTIVETKTPRSSPITYDFLGSVYDYERAHSQRAHALRGQDSGNQTALGHSRHLETTDSDRKQTNPESHDSHWTPQNPILEPQQHQPHGHRAVYKTTLGYNYYATPETTPPRSSMATHKSRSSAYQSTTYSQRTHASQGHESEYKTAFSYDLDHHAALNQRGYHAYPESHEPQWTYASHFPQQQQLLQQEQQQRSLLYSNDRASAEHNPISSFNNSQYQSYYHANGTSMPHSLADARESNSIQSSRSLQQQQQQPPYGNSTELDSTLNGYHYRSSLNPAEYRSLITAHGTDITHQGSFSEQQQQQQQQQLDRGREHVMAFGNNHSNSTTMSIMEDRLFPLTRNSTSAQRGYLPQPQRQQTQGHEDGSRVVDNSSNHHHHITMSPTMLKPVPGPLLRLPPPPPPAASSTQSSGSSGLLLTKAFSPSYSDPDDWVERLLEEEEESFETVGYPESFTDFVTYERYRTQIERSKYEREQKIEARARAIAKAKADGQAKYQAKAQNKTKSAISEVLFSRL